VRAPWSEGHKGLYLHNYHSSAHHSTTPSSQATPPMGWSSWCTNDICGIPDLCSEFEVRNKADAMVANGMRDAGYRMMLLDDCWAAHDRDANGELQPMPWAFPSGMPLAYFLAYLLHHSTINAPTLSPYICCHLHTPSLDGSMISVLGHSTT
jgi:hypothetical protein